MAEFVHLHVHTQYSLLDGAARIDELVSRSGELGMDALAITDHGVMYGVVDFYKACRKAGIKPILGMEAYIAPRSLDEKEGQRDREYAHLVLLAENNTGYQNLIKLSSIGFLEGFYYRPRIDYDTLQKHSEGLIALSACLSGDIPRLLLMGRYDEALALAKRLLLIMGKDNFFIEVQDHGLSEQAQIRPLLVRVAREAGVGLVATNDVHYVNRDDAEAQDALLCIQTQRYVDEQDRMRMDSDRFFLAPPDDMAARFRDIPEAIQNTAAIARRCNVDIAFGEIHLPRYDVPEGEEARAFLRERCEDGLRRKLPDAGADERERLDFELGVIESMGYVDYFLIVWDFIAYAKRNGIVVGPGRGSAAGSLVAYCLDITDVNPIEHGLFFERFLNPERISMPDIDIDFCYERRQEVIDYVVHKYGEPRVAQIITFGTMAARAVIRDVGRVLRMPYGDVDRIAKMIPFEIGMSIERALKLNTELAAKRQSDAAVDKLITLAQRLEGLPRHASTHAAGILICDRPVTDFVPLQKNAEAVTTQFPMGTLEELGLLKMDFLGLRTLTVIRDTIAMLNGRGVEVSLDSLQYDDANVYRMIGEADTDGVFQLESVGMRQFMRDLQPGTFEDITAGIALFRPGPMDQIPTYVACKRDPARVKYAHPLLEPILKGTYGCMIYQEQVMQMVRSLAGYTLGQSDLVRRAMSKKKQDVMAKERERFLTGCGENGVGAEVADAIFDSMMDFAQYAFNKSHAAAYAVIAYQTAYLKYHYPVEFMAALLNSCIGSSEKVAEYVAVCRTHAIPMRPPDVNKSGERFTVEDGGIRFGLGALKNVGLSAIAEIVHERGQHGAFPDGFQFLRRAGGLNKRMVESLIKAGAFDGFGGRRAQWLAVYERAIDAYAQERKNQLDGQISLFEAMGQQAPVSFMLPDVPELPVRTLLTLEKEVLGVYLSGHPLMEWEGELAKQPFSIADILAAPETGRISDGTRVTLLGVLAEARTKPTRAGSLMAYAILEDIRDTIELIVFPKILQAMGNRLETDALVRVTGRVSFKEDERPQIIVDEFAPFGAAREPERLWLRYDEARTSVERISETLRRFPGNHPVLLCSSDGSKKQRAPQSLSVNATPECMQALSAMLGEANVLLAAK